MKFERVISVAGFNSKNYPMLSGIPVELYDRKSRKINDDMNFVEPLFSENLESKMKFKEFLERESKSKILPSNMQGRLTEDVLVIHIPGRAPEFFLRFK